MFREYISKHLIIWFILIINESEKYHLEKIYDWLNNKIKIYDDEIKFNENKNIKLIDITNNKKKINSSFKNIYLIDLKKNIGLAPAVNLGLKFAVDNNYDLAARIDCDFIITKNYLSKMIEMFNNNEEI